MVLAREQAVATSRTEAMRSVRITRAIHPQGRPRGPLPGW
ncbi:hypothetical protein MXAN_5514 [Myxococcus xanthus DK 1622]|uniref:Uncharacterized protein n=1 Tax=Myxococcus xanthus (strain DK1622) TaxID=246197 RepID=Q1D116_MYXXD|nr:hypothetical protein MXAN_5514 [Myxococcus xanthus DK 1622]